MVDAFGLLPQINIPQDPGYLTSLTQGYALGNKMQSDVLNRQVGELAAAGNFADASKAAYAGGNIDLGSTLQKLPVERQVQFYDLLGRTAQAAKTPEQWAQMSQTMTRLFGPESMRGYETVDSRQRAIDLATSAKDKALLQIEQQKAAASTLQAQAAMEGVNVHREALNKPQVIQDKDGGIHVLQPGSFAPANPQAGTPMKGFTTVQQPNPENKWNSAVQQSAGADYGKGLVDDYQAAIKAGNEAQDSNTQLAALSEANKNAKSGALSDTRMKLGQFVRLLGGDPSMLTGNQASMELMNSLSVLGSLNLSQLSKGQISNFEGQQFMRAVAGKENTPEGNQMLIDFAKMANDRKIAIQQAYIKAGPMASDATRQAIRQQAKQAFPLPESLANPPEVPRKGRRGAAVAPETQPAAPTGQLGAQTNPYQPKSVAEFNQIPIGSYVRNGDGSVSQKVQNVADAVPIAGPAPVANVPRPVPDANLTPAQRAQLERQWKLEQRAAEDAIYQEKMKRWREEEERIRQEDLQRKKARQG